MKRILLIILLFSAFFSCEDLDQPMTRNFTETSFWRDEQDALDALAACYENMYTVNYFFPNEALSDNAYNKGTGFEGVGQIASGGYNAATDRINGEWGYHYSCIRRCNIVLENIDRVPENALTEEVRKRMKAEARFIRAFSLFHLATWYGDVPLVTKVLTISESASVNRTPRSEVIAFVNDELASIQPDLPTSYTEDRGRITRGAAIGMRARVNLYESNWAEVVSDCEKLINSTANGAFSLHPSYAGLFAVAGEYNSEVILDLQYGGARGHNVQTSFLPPTVGKLRGNLVPTKALVDDYIMLNGKAINESGSGYDENDPFVDRDPRLDKTIIHHGSTIVDIEGGTQTILTEPGSVPDDNNIEQQTATATGYYFRKYYDQTVSSQFNSGLNLILLRYADVLLMYAEAKNELNAMTADVWNKTIKPVRQRAGFSDVAATEFPASLTQDQLRDVIRRERRTELAFEGLRVFDIRRWKIAEQVLNQPVKGIKVSGQFPHDEDGYLVVEERIFQAPKHYLWPVPQSQLDLNKNLAPNNTGW